jgi:hypothetical protein
MKIKKFKPDLPTSAYYQKIKYFGRTAICFLTNDLKVVAEKVYQGWGFHKIKDGFWLQAPELGLIDLSDPVKMHFYSDSPINVLAYFLYLKNKSDKELIALVKRLLGDGQEIFLSKGEALDVKIIIILEKKVTADNLLHDLYSEFLQSSDYNKYLKKSREIIKNNRLIKVQKNKKINDYSPKVSKFFSEVIESYSLVNYRSREIYNNFFIPGLESQINQLFDDADVFIFIPWGCFKYIGYFISDKMVDKIMLWETHLLEYNNHENIFRERSLKNKKVVIFDNGYTGGTLNKMAKKVKARGGKPIRVVVFPKSRLAIKRSDYAFFIDRLIKSSEIDISRADYYNKLYKKIYS